MADFTADDWRAPLRREDQLTDGERAIGGLARDEGRAALQPRVRDSRDLHGGNAFPTNFR